jgi:AraC-like DNA-binding protein
MSEIGYTKARSMGPVADAVERAGGSLARVFARAELPLRLIERPDQLILLKDQLALVEHAAREIDDEALPLRLSLEAGFRSLGALGERVGAARRFGESIGLCNAGMSSLLQSATHLALARKGALATWSYWISDDARIGRQKNELLAIGYMVDLMRLFFGRGAAPLHVRLPGASAQRARLEERLGCDVVMGERAALVFPADWLEAENPGPARGGFSTRRDIPDPADFAAGVGHLIELGLLDGRPTIDWAARRLGLSRRTLQRRLAASGESFEMLRKRVAMDRAEELLRSSRLSIAQIAWELGYSDPAHFSRATAAFVGDTPSGWRRRLREGSATPAG